MMRLVRVWVQAGLTLALALGLAGCGSKNERMVVKGCVSMGGSSELCKCAYKRVNESHNLDAVEFDKIAFSEEHRAIQKALAQAVVWCFAKNGP